MMKRLGIFLTSFIGLHFPACKTTQNSSSVSSNTGVFQYRLGQSVHTASGVPARNCLAEVEASTYLIPQPTTTKIFPTSRLILGAEDLGDLLANDTAFRLTPVDILKAMGFDGTIADSHPIAAIGRLPVGQYTPLLAVTYSESRKFRALRSVRIAKQYIDMLKAGNYEDFMQQCGSGLVAAEEEGAYFISLTLLDIWGKRDVPSEQAGSAMYRSILEDGLSGSDPLQVYNKLDRYKNADGSVSKQSVVLTFTRGENPEITEGKLTGAQLSALWAKFLKERNEIWATDPIMQLHSNSNSTREYATLKQLPKSDPVRRPPPPNQDPRAQAIRPERAEKAEVAVGKDQIVMPDLARVPMESRAQVVLQKAKARVTDNETQQAEKIAPLPPAASGVVFHRSFAKYESLGAIPLSEEHERILTSKNDFMKLLVKVALETKAKSDAIAYALSRNHQFESLSSPEAVAFLNGQAKSLADIHREITRLFFRCSIDHGGVGCNPSPLETIQAKLTSISNPQQSDPIAIGEWDFCPALEFHSKAEPPCPIAEYKTCRHPDFGVESYRLGRGEVCGPETHFEQHDCKHCGQAGVFGACRKCRHQDHGVEKWQECRHEAFDVENFRMGNGPQCGVARYQQCSDPSFGIARRQPCPKAKF